MCVLLGVYTLLGVAIGLAVAVAGVIVLDVSFLRV